MCLSAICLSTIIGLFSCQKNKETTAEKNTRSLTKEAAIKWFEQNEKNVSGNSSRRSVSNFTPKWDAAILSQDGKYEIVESPLRFEKAPGFSFADQKRKDESNSTINGNSRLLILKNKDDGSISGALMHIYSNSGKESTNLSYVSRGNNFSGFIFYTDLKGKFINGWQYENGKITKTTSAAINRSSEGSRARPIEEECQTIEISIYERYCTYYNDGSSQCTDWNYIESILVTSCTGSGGGGGGGDIATTCDAPNPSDVLASLTSISEIIPTTPGPVITNSTTGETTKTWNLEWYCGTNTFLFYTWKYKSFETAILEKSGTTWKFKSLEHKNILKEGTIPACTAVSHELGSATQEISADGSQASMRLSFSVTVNVTCCAPCPPMTKILPAYSTWYAQ